MSADSVRFKKRKQATYIFLRQLYSFLREKSDIVNLKKIRGMDGNYDPSVEEINIDYRKELIPTLIHEVLHYLHPYWSETKVMNKEREIRNAMTVRQCKNLIKIFASYL